MTPKEIDSKLEDLAVVRNELYKEALKVINDFVSKQPEKIVMLDDDPEDRYSISVCYDGGNHPEYASNGCSMVKSVYINKDGELSLDIEDDNNYTIDRCYCDEVFEIFDVIYNYFIKDE